MKVARTILGAALAASVLAGCGSDSESGSAGDTPGGRGACPIDPVAVVVTVDQWGDIVERLGGDCAVVDTIITGSSADPHDFEPSPSDSAEFEGADLVVVNGLDYDHWAENAIDTLDDAPAVVDGGAVVGLEEGDNPHIWYGPGYVRQIAAAITTELKALAPDAAAYLDSQQAAWAEAMAAYDDQVAAITAVAGGRSFAATEPVFDSMADAAGLTNATPDGYESAALNESEPSPADIAEFEQALAGGDIDVLVFNAQTEGPVPDQLRDAAEAAGVPVVEVTETVPPGTDSFVEWQVTQLKSLATALGA